MKKKAKPRRCSVWPVIIAGFSLTLAGCNSGGENNSRVAPTPARSEFERDLEYVRRAQLTHTYVISRKDGAVLDADDRQFIARNTPAETTHRLITDGNRRAIIGTNFDLYEENKKALQQRFIVESFASQ